MPELPEVETVVRGLREPLIGRTVLSMWYDCDRTVKTPDPDQFAARIAGQTFRSITRRAKYIVCELDHDLLVVHLKMTGRLYVVPDTAVNDGDRWVHFRLQLDGSQQLRFSDARKFGFVALTDRLDAVTPLLGPEPLSGDFSPEVLRARLGKHKKAIKALLLDQAFLAGVGNIYADEALFLAKIHPLRAADSLTDDEIAALFAAIRRVLDAGIEREGASVNWYRKPDGTTGKAQNHFNVYDRADQPCVVCGGAVSKIRVAQRGTHFCPTCQR
ncbi:MAG: bifunctional DNA-formamidopyrimidine glycosylase/DNA-(apurinic or apyrimidinic site) lyase [Anaerolinea sp.]|nr:bifunctional DNA-formamidopyrimidine glycosylase/DNA-(apurinic or apyrimidinic site) lyase [Anaerolinea sp.]